MSEPVVVIPTVPERAEHLARTLAAFAAFGVVPLVTMTEGDARSPLVHGRTGRQAIAAALTDDATDSVLFWEDDVDPSARLPYLLSAMATWPDVTALYTPGESHYSAAAKHWLHQQAGAERPMITRFRATNQANWWGSQAVLLPAWIARRVVAEPEPAAVHRCGLDVIIRTVVRAHGRSIYVTVPNLAQHRAPVSVTSARYKPHRSTSFVG